MRSSLEGYSGVTEGNIFLRLVNYYMQYSFYYMTSLTKAHQVPKISRVYQFDLFFAQILVHEQLTISRCHWVTDVSESDTPTQRWGVEKSSPDRLWAISSLVFSPVASFWVY